MIQLPLTNSDSCALIDVEFSHLLNIKWKLHRGYVSAVSSRVSPRELHRHIITRPAGFVTDHINQNKLDNRRVNLRLLTVSENAANWNRKQSCSTSKYRGVSWSTKAGKWYVQIAYNRRKMFIGTFTHEARAAEAYNVVFYNLYGNIADLNRVVYEETVPMSEMQAKQLWQRFAHKYQVSDRGCNRESYEGDIIANVRPSVFR